MSKSLVSWVLFLSTCLLHACSVGPGRAVNMTAELQNAVFVEEDVLADAPQNREERRRREQRRRDREAQDRERREQERRAREERRRRDRERREQELTRDLRDDPDWPQDRRNPDRRFRRDRGEQRGARRHRAYLAFSWAGGDYDFKDGRGVDDNSAEVYRFQTGAMNSRGTGGGVDLKLYDAKHDAYRGTVGSTGLDQPDAYVFFTQRFGQGRFHVPWRVGPYYSLISTEQNSTGDYTFYNNFGLRLEVEPTLNLIQRRNVTLQAYTTLSAGGHFSYIDDEITRENYTSQGASLGVEPGVRLRLRNVVLGASYHLNETAVRQSSRERARDGISRELPRIETEFKGFMFTLGFRF